MHNFKAIGATSFELSRDKQLTTHRQTDRQTDRHTDIHFRQMTCFSMKLKYKQIKEMAEFDN